MIDAKQEKEREATLYTIMFVKHLGMERGTRAKKTHVKRKQQGRESKGKQSIDPDTSLTYLDIIWKETSYSNNSLNFDDPEMRENFVSITKRIDEKVK
jgi:hypothetical protein